MSKAAKQEEQPRQNTLPLSAMATVLMITPRRLQQLVEEGHVPAPIERGTYAFVPTVQGYLKYLKSDDRRNARNAAEGRVSDARAQEIELRITQRLNELVPIEAPLDIAKWVSDFLEKELNKLPALFAHDVELHDNLDKEVEAALGRMRDHFHRASAALRAGRDPLEAHGDGKPAKAKRTGGKK